MEKIAENQTIIQYLPYVTLWDYLATIFTKAIRVNAQEQLESVQVPKRASYISVIMLELSRRLEQYNKSVREMYIEMCMRLKFANLKS